MIEQLIKTYDLSPHPEGGYFKETYRSEGLIQSKSLPLSIPETHKDSRAYSTAIYFLLPEGQYSKLHRIHSDEAWHFYLGGPLKIVGIDLDGNPYEVVMGQDFLKGQKLQHVVPAGHWFAARPEPGSKFCFVGCTVAPGFDFRDFEMACDIEGDFFKEYPRSSSLSNFL